MRRSGVAHFVARAFLLLLLVCVTTAGSVTLSLGVLLLWTLTSYLRGAGRS